MERKILKGSKPSKRLARGTIRVVRNGVDIAHIGPDAGGYVLTLASSDYVCHVQIPTVPMTKKELRQYGMHLSVHPTIYNSADLDARDHYQPKA
jgi:hypothetical protein